MGDKKTYYKITTAIKLEKSKRNLFEWEFICWYFYIDTDMCVYTHIIIDPQDVIDQLNN